MKAYTETITKKEFLTELKKHQKADNFIRGKYWSDGKGCAVGCSLKSLDTVKKLGIKDFGNHKQYETYLGIPEWLARVEDGIFEGVSVERSKTWPVEFASAINTGADLEKAKAPFMICVLERTLNIKEVKEDLSVLNSIKDVIAKGPSAAESSAWSEAWSEARLAARSVARLAARSVAWFAARSAAESAAESAARLAAMSVAESAAYEFEARFEARSAAMSVAWSAAWFAARSSAWFAVRSVAYEFYADELIKILKKIKK